MSDERMTLYLSTELKESIETQSDRNDQTQNEWVRDAIRRKIKNEKQESVIESTNAEQRLEAIAQETSEKMIDSVRQYQDLMAVDAAYSIVNFQVLKILHGDLAETHIDDMFSHAHQVMHKRSDEVIPDDLDPGIPQQQQQQSNPRASGSHAKNQQNQQQQQDDDDELTKPSVLRNNDSDDSDDDGDNPLRG
jgi:predicted DNA-binding protein